MHFKNSYSIGSVANRSRYNFREIHAHVRKFTVLRFVPVHRRKQGALRVAVQFFIMGPNACSMSRSNSNKK